MSYCDGDVWLDAPATVEWLWQVLEKRGYAPGRDLATFQRRIWEWKSSTYIRVDSVDRWLCFLQMHPVDIPDRLWVRKPELPTTLEGRITLRPKGTG